VTSESFVPKDHPLRANRKIADEALAGMVSLFDSMYASTGRSFIPSEKLLKAQLLMILFHSQQPATGKTDSLQLPVSLVSRHGIGREGMGSFQFHQEQRPPNWLRGAATFLSQILAQYERKRLLSREHFTVGDTLIEAWASIKSFKPKDGPSSAGGGRNDVVDFKGERLSNDTHCSATDPDSRLCRKGKSKEAKLCC
jgi:hypothetical protein